MVEHWTLGRFIAELDSLPKDIPVFITRLLLVPSDFRSYRGDYSQLALGYETMASDVSVGELLRKAHEANGSYFEGYKGGRYIMSAGTPLYLSLWGYSSDRAITGVKPGIARGDNAVFIRFREEKL